MNSEMLIKQIETYSNAIIAFTVLQGIAYSFAFGTSSHFNCLVKTATHLAEGLTLLFLLVAALSIAAIVLMSRVLKGLCGEFADTVAKIYWGKKIVIVIFSLLPMVLTFAYGVRDYPGKTDCKTQAAKARS